MAVLAGGTAGGSLGRGRLVLSNRPARACSLADAGGARLAGPADEPRRETPRGAARLHIAASHVGAARLAALRTLFHGGHGVEHFWRVPSQDHQRLLPRARR